MSLFKRRGGLIGNCCTASASKIACRPSHHYLGHNRLGYEFVRTKPRCAFLRCSRAHPAETHAVAQCARAHIKYTVAYSAFMFCYLLTLCPQSKVHKHLLCSLFGMSLPIAMSQVPTAKNTAGTAAALRPPKNRSKRRDFRKKQGAVGGRRVHVGKIKFRDQHRAEQTRFAQHMQLRCASLFFASSSLWGG